MAAVHPALEFEPFNHFQAEVDYNRALLRRTRIVAWNCSTVTLQAIRDRLVHQQGYAACRLSIGEGTHEAVSVGSRDFPLTREVHGDR